MNYFQAEIGKNHYHLAPLNNLGGQQAKYQLSKLFKTGKNDSLLVLQKVVKLVVVNMLGEFPNLPVQRTLLC